MNLRSSNMCILISSSTFKIELYDIPSVLVYGPDKNRIRWVKLRPKLQLYIKNTFTFCNIKPKNIFKIINIPF